MRDGLLVPMVDEIGVNVVRKEMERFDEIIAAVPEDRRHVAVQAGGHLGIVPKALAQHFHLVYTFEPVPLNFVCLCYNAPDMNIIRMQACLGAKNTPPVMITGWGGNTGYGHVNGLGPFPVIALDTLGLPMIDLLWLDIEGYEPAAIEGAKALIWSHHPVIVVELNKHAARYGHSDEEVETMIEGFGYRVKCRVGRDVIFVPVD